MATKRDRGSSRQWRIREKGYDLSKSFSKREYGPRYKAIANAWVEDTREKIRSGRLPIAANLTLSEVVSQYRENRLAEMSRNTQISYRSKLDWWVEHYGHFLISDLSPHALVQARDHVHKEKSRATARLYLAALGSVFKYMVEQMLLSSNPMRQVPKVPISRKKQSAFQGQVVNPGQLKQVLEACRDRSKSRWLYPFILLAVSTGGRKMEVLNLRWPDIDLAGRTIRFRNTKSGKDRLVPITPTALEALEIVSKYRAVHNDKVFRQNPDAGWLKLKKREGFDYRIHDLRHTCASMLSVLPGMTPQKLCRIMGWSNLQMALRYTHLADSDSEEAFGGLSKQLAELTPD